MAGHSKWANIKYRKEKADKLKGKLFSRITKEIISAVRLGGPDPKGNTRLRLALQKAKEANLPNDNIQRNIKKASSPDQTDFTEVTYEIYGHGGVGLLIEALTDNKNRTASDMRIAINKKGGNLAAPGAVAFNFDKKGIVQVAKAGVEEEALFLAASESGAEDFEAAGDLYLITTAPDELAQVKEKLTALGYSVTEAELEMIPKHTVDCNAEDVQANLELIDWLENLDDVDAVYHNMNLPN
jgi:YebC/PmpR family DNA-binding regulatory protein